MEHSIETGVIRENIQYGFYCRQNIKYAFTVVFAECI